MITQTTLQPDQKGTERLMKKYGERLACVRYRHDTNGTRYTTVELIETEQIIQETQKLKWKDTDFVDIRINYN